MSPKMSVSPIWYTVGSPGALTTMPFGNPSGTPTPASIMVAVAVGDQDMRRALDGLVAVAIIGRVAGEEGVNQDDFVREIETKGRMAEPRDLHGAHLPARMRLA